MADTEISPFLNKLGYMLLAEVDSLHEVENELWSLHWLLTRLTSFPMDVSKDYYLMEYRKKAMEVITILHEAEDVIDSYLDTTKCRNYSTSAHKVLKFTSQIKGMMDKLKGLHVWFHDHFTKSCSTCGTSSSSKRSLANEVGDHMVVVLEDEVQKMIDLLKDEEDPQREVIPVVGPGGIGKTTLVRKVYNHPTIVEHFPCRSWIYVSSDYKLEELLQDIIDQIKPTSTAPAGSGSGSAAAARNIVDEEMMSLKDLAIQTYELLKTTSTRSEAAVAATKMKFQQTDLGNGFYECIFSSDDDPPPPTLIKEERSKRMKKKFIQKKRKERSLFNWNLYQPTKTWDGITGPFLQRIFNNLVSLRVLDLSIGFYNIPRQIDLIHLRYLRLENISGDSFSRRNYVTSAISGLWNLQFLKIKGYFTELEISEMKQLRHLSSDVYVELSLEIEERSDSNVVFKNLQTLKGCPIDYILGEDILSKMTNLVTLHLLGVVRCEKLLVRGFPLLKRLQELKLTGQAFRSSDTSPYKLELFPPNITHLTLQRTFVQRRYVMQALRKLKNLRVLKLKFGSISEKEDLDLGRDGDGAGEGDGDGDGDGFLQLKFLKLKDLFQSGQLRKWHMSKGVMPSLEKVAIINCKNLEGLPSAALEVIPTLQELEVDASNDQVLTDARLIEERMGKDRLKLSLIQ
ncbi:uncharacterized protein LOC122074890 isoform X2 [Macadamia integrifolia]|uniref:uncharacterized protein LOC122074890 isoform X2 n=1 Tax=Macadamia integrifolia TaxID=60698 RepID=UPI001C4E2ED8|nr:uncharacterized protein LOC122074890 isoform X2 [Macadamia integrifolia]